jgi:UDP-N-acetylglucosamine:LPS N-acetylglucosamine transferase
LKALLVCSSGGHLSQLLLLKPWWEQRERHWVTFDTLDARSSLADEQVTWAFHPTTRNLPNAARNLRLAWWLFRRERPDVLASTGAGVAFPFFVIAKLFGVKTVYVEVFDRIDHATLTGALCYPLADVFAIQWPEQATTYPQGEVIGWLT